MSRENVEIVRTAFDAFNRRDWDRFFQMVDPQVVWRTDPTAPDAGTYIGHDGVRELIEHDWMQTFDNLRVELLEVIDGGDHGVVVAARMTGEIKGTDSPVSIDFGEVFTLRDGRVAAIRDHTTLEQALEAVGLSE
jgi:uncharacterized protein